MPDENETSADHVREISCNGCSTRYQIGVIEEPVLVLKAIVALPEYEWRYVRTDSFSCECGKPIRPTIPIWIDKTDPSPHLKIAWHKQLED